MGGVGSERETRARGEVKRRGTEKERLEGDGSEEYLGERGREAEMERERIWKRERAREISGTS